MKRKCNVYNTPVTEIKTIQRQLFDGVRLETGAPVKLAPIKAVIIR